MEEARGAAGNPVGMLILGIVLLLIGFLFGIKVLWIIGLVLAIVGAVLLVAGGMGRPVAGRRYWY